MSEHFKESGPVGASDLQYWFSIRQPVVAAPMAEESEVTVTNASPIIMESEPVVAENSGNPLTNAVPAAVVMGAADAPEEVSVESVAVPPQANAEPGE